MVVAPRDRIDSHSLDPQDRASISGPFRAGQHGGKSPGPDMLSPKTPMDSELLIQVRSVILQQAFRAHVGHIGSALAIADIMATLYHDILRIASPDDSQRDRFILSKGHGALALYAALFATGRISKTDLGTYCGDQSLLGVHPQHGLPYVEFTTGSLGQGLSWGVGLALASRMLGSPGRTFVLLSDGECNEGAVWEAIMYASQHRLGSLYAIIDIDGQQALGLTKDVIDLEPMQERWRAFGWDVHEVNGHEPQAIIRAIALAARQPTKPHVLLARTVFGNGVAFMEGKIAWHYLPLSRAEYALAMKMVGAGM